MLYAWHSVVNIGPSWSWSYGCWIYNYLCNQCLSRCEFESRSGDTVCQWLATGQWFSPSTPVSSINKTDRHDIAEILVKVALNTINQSSVLNNDDWHDTEILRLYWCWVTSLVRHKCISYSFHVLHKVLINQISVHHTIFWRGPGGSMS